MVYPNNKNSEGSILHMFMFYEVAYCLQYLITWINLILISQYMSILLTVSIFFSKGKILGWPESVSLFFFNILWKNQNKRFGQPNITLPALYLN